MQSEDIEEKDRMGQGLNKRSLSALSSSSIIKEKNAKITIWGSDFSPLVRIKKRIIRTLVVI